MAGPSRPLILASASPRRSALLRELGLDPDIRPADVDESPRPGERADRLVARLSEAKARAIAARMGISTGAGASSGVDPTPDGRGGATDAVVLGADTVVVLGHGDEERILGKPADRDEARTMLAALSGREHRVLTGVFVTDGRRHHGAVESTTVRFAVLDDERIDAYLASGEADDKAGAYAIQGLGGAFVTDVVGSRSNVIGLPLGLVVELLGRLGSVVPGEPVTDP